MSNNRRSFLKKTGMAGLLLMAGVPSWARKKQKTIQLTVLHSNDVHSQIDAFPANHSRFPGKGGPADWLISSRFGAMILKHWRLIVATFSRERPILIFIRESLRLS